MARYILHRLREWDVISANRVDYFIANSQHTARRIWRCYRREAKVIYPPVDVDRFKPLAIERSQKDEFYLTVCRLVSYKKVGLIIEAFNQLKKPLIVIGTGSQLKEMRALAQPNVQVLGWQSAEIVEKYMAKAQAFVYAACEDFGIALVESQACGTPVIAYKQGGAVETVKDIQKFPQTGTGVFFLEQSVAAIIEAVETFDKYQSQITTEQCCLQSDNFSQLLFHQSYQDFVEQCINQDTVHL